MIYKDIEPLISNTEMQVREDENGEVISYRITPSKGYKLHTIHYDIQLFDSDTGEPIDEYELGYTTGTILVGNNYDFEENPFDIYSVLIEE